MNLLEIMDTRSKKVKELDELVYSVEKELRKLNEDEVSVYDGIKNEISELDNQIRLIEEEDKKLIQRSQDTSLKNNDIKMNDNQMNFREFIAQYRNGNTINDFKIESRAVVLSSGVYDTAVDGGISAVGYEPFYKQMGVQVLAGLTKEIKLPYVNGIIAGNVAEGSASDNDKTLSYVTLSPERFTITETFSKEILAIGNEAAFQGILAEMVKGVDKAITKKINAVVVAGATTLASGATYSVTNMNTLTAAVDGNVTLLMPRAEFYKAKAVAVDTGSGLFVANKTSQYAGNLWDGTPLFYSALFVNTTGNTVAAVDLSQVTLGEFGSEYEVIIDQVTKAPEGQVKVTVCKIADVVLRNADAARLMKIG